MGRTSQAAESSQPLLGPPRPGDDDYDEWDSADSSSAPPALTPSTLSVGEWDADDRRQSEHEQEPLLIDHAPPPAYEQTSTTSQPAWQAPAGDKGPAPPYSTAPNGEAAGVRLTEIDVEFTGQNPRCCKRKQRCRRSCKGQGCCGMSKMLCLGLAIALFAISAVGTFCLGRFVRLSLMCSVQDFSTKDYQIATLDHFEYSDSDDQNSGLPAKFPGVLHILTGPPGQAVDLNVSVRATAHDLKHSGGGGADWRPRKLNQCAEVSLFFRPGLDISSLRIDARKAKLVLASDVRVSGATSIALRNGNLVAKHFGSSRETYIDVRSSSVSGTFALLDALSIKTRSGSVSIDVEPKPADKSRPRPAVLNVESRSGSVNVQYPASEVADIPDRDYRTSVSTQSGAVQGTFLHGRETNLDLRAGNLDARILPYGAGSRDTSKLTTKMQSGSSHLEVLPPPRQAAAGVLSRLRSVHSSKSGSLRLQYPEEWQGEIFGEAKSGSLTVSGPNVKLDESRGSRVHGVKGDGKSELKIMVHSGSGDAVIG